MQVLHEEGVANHLGPKPCVGTRAGDCKASAGERVGQPLSPERSWIPGADAFQIAEGNTDEHGRREVANMIGGRDGAAVVQWARITRAV